MSIEILPWPDDWSPWTHPAPWNLPAGAECRPFIESSGARAVADGRRVKRGYLDDLADDDVIENL